MPFWEHSLVRWLRAPLCAALIATPFTLGVVWRHQTDQRRAKLDNVCQVLTGTHDDFQRLKDYVNKFVTTPRGKKFVAGLPVPPKPTC